MGVLMRRAAAVAAISFALVVPARALETDQFYAWKRPLRDATGTINAQINANIDQVLAQVNARRDADTCSCRSVQKAIRHGFLYPFFVRPEVWATNTSRLDRVPSTPDEELKFRHDYVYGSASALDVIRWMPPSPTIEVGGIRIGTDKLSHFFSEGSWLYNNYRRFRANGGSEDAAVQRAVEFGIATERTVLGGTSSGVLSLADVEANYQGFLFYRGLCEGPNPGLKRTPEGWRLDPPFDLAAYVSPEWDESWQPNIFLPKRWAKVKPVMERYCPLLRDPEIVAQRKAYAERDRITPSEEVVTRMVREGKLRDPRPYTIVSLCGGSADSASAPGAGGDDLPSIVRPGVDVAPGRR